MRTGWMGAAIALVGAIAACNGSKSGSSSGSGSGSSEPPVPPPPPKVQLVRCAPAPVVPFDAEIGGILGDTALQQGGAFASLTGTGDISSGFDDKDIQGGLLGSDAGDTNGGFGFGRTGFGPGGGGPGKGTIGTGRYGTIGHGTGTGRGYGNGRGGTIGRDAQVPQIRIGQPASVGDLDKAIIRRYVKRNINKIEYCYEKQLLAKPDLEGTVQVQFFIGPDGLVKAADASGVSGEVASCIAGVFKDIEFPKPKGGGGVQVTYPFTFHPSGGDDPVAVTPTSPGSAADPVPAPPTPVVRGWTPYAQDATDVPPDVAGALTLATQAAVQSRIAGVDQCFGARPDGTLRAMIAVGVDGAITGVRAGGLGDAAVEACVAKALGAIHVSAPTHPGIEVACDLARGPEQPWRVSIGDYDVIEVGRSELRHAGARIAFDAPADAFDGGHDYLILADPDATGAGLVAARARTTSEHSTLYAIKDGGGAPRFAGIGPGGSAPRAAPDAPRLTVAFHKDGTVDVCAPGAGPTQHARTSVTTDLDRAFGAIAGGCRTSRCSDAVAVAADELTDAGALLDVLGRARAAGFTRILIGGPIDPCAP